MKKFLPFLSEVLWIFSDTLIQHFSSIPFVMKKQALILLTNLPNLLSILQRVLAHELHSKLFNNFINFFGLPGLVLSTTLYFGPISLMMPLRLNYRFDRFFIESAPFEFIIFINSFFLFQQILQIRLFLIKKSL